jgi:uncharacterized protein YecE (DUF72 family)
MALLVGTSGFDYRDWRGPFYPRFLRPNERLAFYAEHFQTVELNVTFYRMPAADAFLGWRDAVPDDFVFAVKASRYLTHILRLNEPQRSVDYLMERASLLEDRLGPILVQLPPSMAIDLERLDATLRAFGGRARVAFEPRHASWWHPDLCALLREHDAAIVLADRRRPITPLWASTSWTYLRLHEGRATPRPCYGDRALMSWIDRLAALPERAGERGYVYFNNDHRACAPANAVTFGGMLQDARTATAATTGPASPG